MGFVDNRNLPSYHYALYIIS
uniref:Uncharacterized protein n=1 Tax=Arundo donax TaxID=35708 RepID=A0A0A9AVY3_ARUDO